MRFTFSRGSAPGCSVDLVSVGPFPDGSALFGWRSTACRRSRTIAIVMGLILHDGLLFVHARPRQHGSLRLMPILVWFSAMRGQIHILDPAEGLGRPDWLMRRLIRPTLMYVRPRPHNCALVHMDSRIPRILRAVLVHGALRSPGCKMLSSMWGPAPTDFRDCAPSARDSAGFQVVGPNMHEPTRIHGVSGSSRPCGPGIA